MSAAAAGNTAVTSVGAACAFDAAGTASAPAANIASAMQPIRGLRARSVVAMFFMARQPILNQMVKSSSSGCLALSADAGPDDDPCSPRRDHRDVAVHGVLGLGVGRHEVEAACHRLQNDSLLGHRQGRAETAADAAAEGNPLVRAGLAVLPALRP